MTSTTPLTAEQIAQQFRTDVVGRDPIACRTRHHGGRCVVETLSDGTTRHREELPAPWGAGGRAETRLHVMTATGLRYR